MPTQGSRSLPGALRLLPFLGLALAASCKATTLAGGHVKREPGPTPRELDGFPFVLTRPAFSITRDEKGIDALAVTWVPDMRRIYTLRQAPSCFADSKFTLELNRNGSLKSLAASSTENVTPTLKVIGQVAASAIGLRALGAEAESGRGALDFLGVGPSSEMFFVANLALRLPLVVFESGPFLARLGRMALPTDPYTSKLVWDKAWLAPVGSPPQPYATCEKASSWSEDHWRAAQVVEMNSLVGLIGKLLQPRAFRFVPWTEQEALWLSTAGKLIACESSSLDELTASLEWIEHVREKAKEAPCQRTSEWEDAEKKKCGRVAEIVSRLWPDAPAAWDCTPDGLKEIEKAAKERKKSVAAEAKTLKVLSGWEGELRLGAIEEIEREIEQVRREDAKAGNTVPTSTAALENKWAVAVGAYEERKQEVALLRFLAEGVRPNLAERPKAEAAQDYERARLQLAAVRRTMTEKRSRFKRAMPEPLPVPKNESVEELSLDKVAEHVFPPTSKELRRLLEQPPTPELLEAVQKAAEKMKKKTPRFVLIRAKELPREEK